MFADFRYALRSCRCSPGFALSTIATLGLSTGSTLAVFALAYGLLLRPLPVADEARLVVVYGTNPQLSRFQEPVPFVDFIAWQARSQSYDAMAAVTARAMDVSGDEGAERLDVQAVSWNFFQTLGVTAGLGRVFHDPREGEVCVISRGLWQRRFGGDPSVVGRRITIGGSPFMVIGVMPSGFERWRGQADVWVPAAQVADLIAVQSSPGYYVYTVIARLKRGIDIRVAERETRSIAAGLGDARGTHEDARLVPLRSDVVSDGSRRLLVLLTTVIALVWATACANLGGVLLARHSERTPELAVRLALGAGAMRIVRQLISETLLLAVAGTTVGIGIATASVRMLLAVAPPALDRPDVIRMDAPVLLAAAALALCTTASIAILPACYVLRGRLHTLLQDARAQSTASRRFTRIEDLLVIGEVATATVVLVSAALVVRSFVRVQAVPLGFRAQSVLTLRLGVPARFASNPSTSALASFQDAREALRTRIEAVAGVRRVAYGTDLPIPNGGQRVSITLDSGRRFLNGVAADLPLTPGMHYVTSGYFASLGARIVQGRDVQPSDRAGTPLVVLVNERMAQLHWPRATPIGRRIGYRARRRSGPATDEWLQIIGVVSDMRYVGPETPIKPEIYAALMQWEPRETELVVEAWSDATRLVATIRDVTRQFDPDTSVIRVATLRSAVADATAQPRYRSVVLTTFGALAAALSASGLYAALALRVGRRRRELAIRLALGATERSLRLVILRHAFGLLLPSIALGLAGAGVAARLMQSQLFEVSAFDPAAFAAAAAISMIVGVAAAYVPARSAALVDPVALLRAE